MANELDELPKDVHDRIFRERILTSPNFAAATSHERPTLIILGGQPGAGKGGLARDARIELNKDVVIVDPDELRDNHPNVRRFQSEDPYEWSSRTHKDAGAWADELRLEAMAEKKNLIYDTTLSSGDWTLKVIEDAKAQGYDIEVRVVASPKLESELGVDKRFTEKLDNEGRARYVPEGARDVIYERVPTSLDTIHSKSDVPIRIFNREGTELYDSRTDALSPGRALEEARFSRLKDPAITQSLREGWNEQTKWHHDLPEHARGIPNMDADVQSRLLEQHAKLKVQEGVNARAEGSATIDALLRPGAEPVPSRIPGDELPNLSRAGTTAALAGVGLAAAAYDAKLTGERMGTAYAQDNPTAARSEATHLLARTGGGAAAGVTVYAAGVTGGPAVALAVADAYLLVEAAERGAKFLDVRKITHQTGSDGADYVFNGKQWIRDDLRADFRDDGVDRPKQQDFAAMPEIARELNAKASAEAVSQAIGKVDPRDPFVQPSNESDPSHLRVRDWTHDAETGRWSRTVADEFDRNDAPVWKAEPEYAQPARAAELDRQALEVIDRNIVEGPAVLAARYQVGAKRSGFGDFGAEPGAVATALNPNTLEASNGQQYVRDPQGGWSHDGVPATGNRALELETTRERLLPVLAEHQKQLAETKPYEPPTPEQRDRAMLRVAYNNEGWNPSPEQFEASYLAVSRTRQMSGLTAENSGLVLEKDANGQASLNGPILHTRMGPNNEVQVAAKTYSDEIEVALNDVRARGLPKAEGTQELPVQAIEQATTGQREAREQTQREANRAGLSQDETQAAVRAALPTMMSPGARSDKPEQPDRAPKEEAKPEREGAMLLDNPAHQNHEMFATLLHAVNERDKEHGREPDEFSRQLAGGLVEKARERGLDTIGAARFTPDGTKVGMTDTADLSSPWAKTAVGDVGQLVGQKLSQSSENVAAINQQQALKQSLKPAQPAQAMDGPEAPTPKGPRLP